MAKKSNFLKQFIKDKNMVGAVSPSSKYLGARMIENIDFKKDKKIIELGPGTGVFTEILLDRMADDAELYIFELNEYFYDMLKERFDDPRVHIIHDSAENIAKHVPKESSNCQDVVVSSLPLMMFPDELRRNVVDAAYNSLKKNGRYIQFQYSLQSKKFLESIFSKVNVKFTVINFPPAFVYTCRKD